MGAEEFFTVGGPLEGGDGGVEGDGVDGLGDGGGGFDTEDADFTVGVG